MEKYTSLLNADYFDDDLEFITDYRKNHFEATEDEFEKVIELIDGYAHRVGFDDQTLFLDTQDPRHGEYGEKNVYTVYYDDMTILLVATSKADADWIMDGMKGEITELFG